MTKKQILERDVKILHALLQVSLEMENLKPFVDNPQLEASIRIKVQLSKINTLLGESI